LTVLVDSCAWIEYFRGSEISAEIELILFSTEEIIMSTVNIAEVYRYFLSQEPKHAESCLKFMLERSFVIPVTTPIAKKAAEIRAKEKFGLGDAFILSTARLHDAKILTCDSDFRKDPNAMYLPKRAK